MAIRITEDGTVIYENEPNVERELFPNIPSSGVTPEQITQAVNTWLEEHPEATTTVEDGSITKTKLDSNLQAELDSMDSEIGELADTKAPVIYGSASGAIASFKDGADDLPMKSCVVNIEPIQEGSGDPSPENVRPISGRTGLTVSHSGADTTDPTTISVNWETEAGTVYGGYVNVVSGKLTVDRAMVDLGTLSWNYEASIPRFYSSGINSVVKKVDNNSVANCVSSMFKPASFNDLYLYSKQNGSMCINDAGTISIIDNAYSDTESFRSAMSGVQLVYELATPTEIQLTPHEVRTLLGVNNIWSGGGDMAVEYPADTKLYTKSPVQDVQVNGTSIVTDGVANVPMADDTTAGVIIVDRQTQTGLQFLNGKLQILPANNSDIKRSWGQYRVITSMQQHIATFYGLAKAAGDTTQSGSSNAVGAYTEEAKSAIQVMLGISDIIGSIEGAMASNSYSVGDVFLHKGALYKATNAIAPGDAIVPGTNCEQTTIIDILKGA